jgi:hypothetical protein
LAFGSVRSRSWRDERCFSFVCELGQNATVKEKTGNRIRGPTVSLKPLFPAPRSFDPRADEPMRTLPCLWTGNRSGRASGRERKGWEWGKGENPQHYRSEGGGLFLQNSFSLFFPSSPRVPPLSLNPRSRDRSYACRSIAQDWRLGLRARRDRAGGWGAS